MEKKTNSSKIYVSFDITDAKIYVNSDPGQTTLHIENKHDSLDKCLVLDNKIVEDFEKTLPIIKQFDNITFTVFYCSPVNIEIFRKITYGLIAEKIVLRYENLEHLYKYLQNADSFVKINKLLFSKQPSRYNPSYLGRDHEKELIQNILDICCGLIEKETITEIEIPNWDSCQYHISANVRAVCVLGNLFLTLGKPGEATGKIEVIDDDHEIAWDNE